MHESFSSDKPEHDLLPSISSHPEGKVGHNGTELTQSQISNSLMLLSRIPSQFQQAALPPCHILKSKV